MPPQQPGSLSRQQAIDLAAFILRAGKFAAGQTDLGSSRLGQVAFPARASPAVGIRRRLVVCRRRQPGATDARRDLPERQHPVQRAGEGSRQGEAGDADPVRLRPVGIDGVLTDGRRSIRPRWRSIETTPLFLLPGRRCENGRPVPVDRADWKQYTAALMDVGRPRTRPRRSRNVDAVEQGRRAAQRDVRELPQGVSRRRARGKHGWCQPVPVS